MLCICIVLYVVEDLEIDWIESFVFWELVLQQEGEDMRTDWLPFSGCKQKVVKFESRAREGYGRFFFLKGKGVTFYSER